LKRRIPESSSTESSRFYWNGIICLICQHRIQPLEAFGNHLQRCCTPLYDYLLLGEPDFFKMILLPTPLLYSTISYQNQQNISNNSNNNGSISSNIGGSSISFGEQILELLRQYSPFLEHQRCYFLEQPMESLHRYLTYVQILKEVFYSNKNDDLFFTNNEGDHHQLHFPQTIPLDHENTHDNGSTKQSRSTTIGERLDSLMSSIPKLHHHHHHQKQQQTKEQHQQYDESSSIQPQYTIFQLQ